MDQGTVRALGTPRRRMILRLVWDGEQSAGAIHRALGDVTFGAVSQHLAVLCQAGLLVRREQGRQRLYRARKGAAGPLRHWLEGMWATALDELALRAEMEEARRGPRPRSRAPGRLPGNSRARKRKAGPRP